MIRDDDLYTGPATISLHIPIDVWAKIAGWRVEDGKYVIAPPALDAGTNLELTLGGHTIGRYDAETAEHTSNTRPGYVFVTLRERI